MRRKSEPAHDEPASRDVVPVRSPDASARHARRRLARVMLALACAPAYGCGDVVRTGRAPVVLVINRLEGASGAEPARFTSVLHSDVETLVERSADGVQASVPTLFADEG